jgi:DNA-nicking Smr family endonuclease
MSKKKSGSRDITPDEKDLWEEVTRADKPLKKRSRVVTKPKVASKKIEVTSHSHMPISYKILPELSRGEYANIDRNTQERFRKGDMDMDGRLDLHGFTCDEAREMVAGFIASHYSRGSRFLLIITGKGTFRKEGEERAGVLKGALPSWLSEPDIRPYILAFDTAKAKHGGSGAFYVLLRRKR